MYVWQRSYTRALADAVARGGGSQPFRAVRVLVAELPDAPSVSAGMHAVALHPGLHVVPVVRVSGASGLALDDDLLDRVGRRLAEATAEFTKAGAHVVGVEVDHDCASARLMDYAQALNAVRAHTGALPLSITALPSWSDAPALHAVLRAVDAVVLQLHAVDAPHAGLFSAQRARAQLDAFVRAARQSTTLWIALPGYGHPQRDTHGGLWADPREVDAFLSGLRDRPVPSLAGVAWFRLPVPGDVDTWGVDTFDHVRRGDAVHDLRVVRIGADVVLDNRGTVDAVAPRRVPLDVCPTCPADGVAGYALVRAPQGAALTSAASLLVRAGERRTIGWAR